MPEIEIRTRRCITKSRVWTLGRSIFPTGRLQQMAVLRANDWDSAGRYGSGAEARVQRPEHSPVAPTV